MPGMRQKCKLQYQATSAQDDYGAHTPVWADAQFFWAVFVPMKSSEIVALGKDTEFATHLLVVNKKDVAADNAAKIHVKNRIVVAGVVYEIVSRLVFDKQWQLKLLEIE